MRLKSLALLVSLLLMLVVVSTQCRGEEDKHAGALVRLKDIATVEGVRDNPIVGYGLVVGLNGTGDRRQTLFSTQTLANMLRRMGLLVDPDKVRVNNVAAVSLTAVLPPFARPGTRVDVTVSSLGDARSLEGGMLLLAPLYGSDGQPYAAAQGAVVLGGYTAGTRGNSIQVNHPTVGRIPEGAIVERNTALDLRLLDKLALLLRDPDFSTARDAAAAINRDFGKNVASVVDARRIELVPPGQPAGVPELLARVEEVLVPVHRRAKVVVNERTGTVVMGKDVRLGAVSVLHGNIAIQISTEFTVSQPATLAQRGDTVVVPQTTVRSQETPARRIELNEGATVEELVRGLQAIGATARDIIAILEAVKSAGGLEAELEVM